MVAQQPQLQLQSQQPTPSAQDEALKRNTDCVYFLASPLTCKKGNECEYRHSEYARVNPRDCRYWLGGNCLNPNCSFRHPPLDGLLGTQATTPGGSSVPPPQFPTASAAHSSKQAVPCIFFQKGLCLKGDRCAFSHGPPTPNTVNNKIAAQIPATSQGAENPSFKMAFGSVEKNALEKKIPLGNVAKSGAGPEVKPAQKVETAPLRNMSQLEKKVLQPSAGVDNGASRFKRSSPPVTNGPVGSRSNRPHQARVLDDHNFPSGKDSDEFLRESSPGFDVLVADETRNSDYYHGEDEFGKGRVEDKGHGDYNLAADIDRERFHVPQGYESYDHLQDSYGWEQHRRAPALLDRRTRRRSDSPDNPEVSDLRHHLSKRRKGNGLKSVVGHHYEGHGEEQSHRSHSRKDSLNESSLGSRFRGRITLPANGGGDHLEREGRGGFRSRLSSGGRLPAPHQGRIHDRIQGRLSDDERRSSRERLMGRDLGGDRSDFAGPKSLAELKNGSNTEAKEFHSLGRRRGLRDQSQSDDDFQFEGPKPLSEILKEKRGAGSGADAASKNENGSDPVPVRNTQNGGINNEEEPKPQVADVSGDVDSSQAQLVGEMAYHEQPGEDQDYEGDDQREGDYEYEQGDEGYYEYEQGDEGEIQEEEEYMDEEDDGDDFAKKIGVVQP